MEKLPLAEWRARRLAVLQLVLAATGVTAVLTWLADSPHDAIDGALVVASISVVTLPYVLWRAARRVRRHWNAFELSIGGDTLRMAAKGAGRVTVRRDEIVELVEGLGGLVVRSSQPGVVARIPLMVEGYADVRARVADGRPIASRPDALAWAAGLVVAGLAFGGLVFVFRWSLMLALALVVCQLTLAGFGAVEVLGNPLPSSATKLRTIVFALASALLPVAAMFR